MLAGGGGQHAVGQGDVVQGVVDRAGWVGAGSALVTVPPLMASVGMLVELKPVAEALGRSNTSVPPALTVIVRLLLAAPKARVAAAAHRRRDQRAAVDRETAREGTRGRGNASQRAEDLCAGTHDHQVQLVEVVAAAVVSTIRPSNE